jgi:hypothetical protein
MVAIGGSLKARGYNMLLVERRLLECMLYLITVKHACMDV